MKRYQSYVNAIPFTDKKHLIVLPLLVAFLIYLAPTVLQLVFTIPFPAPLEQIGSLPAALSMVVTVPLALFVMKKLTKIRYKDLGLIKEGWFKQFLIGEFGGGLLLTFVVLTIWALGGIQLQQNPQEGSFAVLATGLVFFIFQGTWEEVIYRTYLMPHFSKVMGDGWSILFSSALFTLGHALNPGMQPLPILNLFIGSLVFSLVYYYTGSLLIVGVGHGLWNYCQGFVFGAQVSGNTISDSMMISTPVPGRELISGGNFGFEGGLVTTLTGLALIGLFVYLCKKQSTPR